MWLKRTNRIFSGTRHGLDSFRIALSFPMFRQFAIGNITSMIGRWMQRVAVGWLAWQLTGSAFWVGFLAFADLFPAILFGFLGGILADRYSRLEVFKITLSLMLLQSVLLAILSASGLLTFPILFLLTASHGILFALNHPARLSIVTELVDRPTLPAAIAFNSICVNISRFVGPAFAGLVIAESHISAIFVITTLTYMAMLGVLFGLGPALKSAREKRKLEIPVERSVLQYFSDNSGIRDLLMIFLGSTVLIRAFTELYPAITGLLLNGGAAVMSVLLSALGAGSIVGGIIVVAAHRKDQRLDLIAIAFVLQTLGLVAILFSHSQILAAMGSFVLGIGVTSGAIVVQTVVQESVPDELRGRVIAIYGMFVRGGAASGAILFGLLGDFFGLRIVGAGTTLIFTPLIAFYIYRKASIFKSF